MMIVRYTWADVERMVGILVGGVVAVGKQYHAIVPIPRGGFVPATMMSHQLNLPLDFLEDSAKIFLVVDDIADHGMTLEKLREDFEDMTFDVATLMVKEHTPVNPTYSAAKVPSEEWVVFPWENPHQARQNYEQYKAEMGG